MGHFRILSILQVRAVKALSDGRRLASASQDHTAKFWLPRDGKSDGAAGGGVYYDMGGKQTSRFFVHMTNEVLTDLAYDVSYIKQGLCTSAFELAIRTLADSCVVPSLAET